MNEGPFRKLSDLLDGRLVIDHLGELMPGLLYLFDLVEHRNIYANRSLSELLGYSQTEVAALGDRVLSTIVHPDDLPRTAAHHAGMPSVAPGAVVEIEYRVRDASGQFRWLHSWEIIVARDDSGRPLQLLGIAQDITARVHAEEELRESRRQSEASEQRWRSIAENPFDFVVVIDRDYKYTFVNFVAPGLRIEDLIGKATPFDFVSDSDRAVMLSALQTVFQEGRPASYEVSVPTLQKWYLSVAGPIREGGVVTHCSILTREVTAEKLAQAEALRAEKQLRLVEVKLAQAAKLEAVGRLAGGIAHDFNNLLTGMAGLTESLATRLGPDDPGSEELAELRGAVARGAGLTRQLLAFSRQQPVAPVVLDMNALLSDVSRMLGRLIGADIALTVEPSSEPVWVRGDRSQLEQVLVNLAVNARDAMPAGGRLQLSLSEVLVSEDALREHPDARPGQFARLQVNDTGCGMDEGTIARIFEPFFTTKPVGSGTGLGLAMAHGVVSKAGGFIVVRSLPGTGAEFQVHLPLVESEKRSEPALPATEERRGSQETVLLVEDEPLVLRVTRQQLLTLGYRVTTASSGDEALALITSAIQFDVLLTDVRLPGMGGPRLFERACQLRGPLPVVFMSGYTDDMLPEGRIDEKRAAFLQKPFNRDQLAAKLREVLGG